MKHRPLFDNVVVRPDLPKQIGSIIVPEIAQKPNWIGTVVAVGKGRLTPRKRGHAESGGKWADGVPGEWRTPDVEVGERVAYDRRSAVDVDWEGELEKCHMVTSQALFFAIAPGADVEIGDPCILKADYV